MLDAGGFDERLHCAEEYDLWLKLLQLRPEARGVSEPLMCVDAAPRPDRLSGMTRNRFQGHMHIYRLHKANLSRAERRRKLYAIRKMLHPDPPLWRILWMCSGRERLTELRRWLKLRFKGGGAIKAQCRR